MISRRLLVGVFGAALVLSACGSSSTPTPGATTTGTASAGSAPSSAPATTATAGGGDGGGGSADACALLTRAQVGASLGVAVDDGRHVVPNSTLLCGWAESAVAPGTGTRVTLTISTEKAFTLGQTPITGITKTPVSDIGDAAYYVTASGLGTTLNVKKGTSVFAVAVLTEGAISLDDTKAAEKALALEVLARL